MEEDGREMGLPLSTTLHVLLFPEIETADIVVAKH